jgi:hypothetical protein
MKKRTRSILEELNNLGHRRNTESLIETRGSNIIESSINLMQLIRQEFAPEEAGELERRFLNAIRCEDPKKFKRGISKIAESRKTDQNTAVSEENNQSRLNKNTSPTE